MSTAFSSGDLETDQQAGVGVESTDAVIERTGLMNWRVLWQTKFRIKEFMFTHKVILDLILYQSDSRFVSITIVRLDDKRGVRGRPVLLTREIAETATGVV